MARNASPGERFEVTLSRQSVQILQELARNGVWGRSAADVGGRLIEQALQTFVATPSFDLDVLSRDDEESK